MQCVGKFVPYLYIFSVQVRHATVVVLSSAAGVFEEDSGKFGQSCSNVGGFGLCECSRSCGREGALGWCRTCVGAFLGIHVGCIGW